MRIVADASALAAAVFEEDGFESIAVRFQNVTIHVPELLKAELANIAVKKARRRPEYAAQIFSRLQATLERRRSFKWHEVHPVDVAILASLTGLSAYDATYVWLAGWLEADLVTLDRRLAAAAGMATELAE